MMWDTGIEGKVTSLGKLIENRGLYSLDSQEKCFLENLE